jgi:hypothetical protein
MLSAGLTADGIKAKRVPSLSPLNQGFSPTQGAGDGILCTF